MALARSASGPGGLSINTNSANSLFGTSNNTTPAAGGLFGAAQPAKPTPSLFGQSATSTNPAAGGGLFGSTATTLQPQTGNLFGSAATSQPQTGGLFGASTTTTQPQTGGMFGSSQPQQGGGLFGSTSAQTGGLFGSSTTTSQPQRTGGLFSGLGTQPTQNQSSGSGLFGSTAPTQPAQNAGLFGGLNSQAQNKPATSLFGGLGNNQNQQSQLHQTSLFSSVNNQPQQQQQQMQTSGLFGGLTMGQSTNQQPQTVPGVRIDMNNVRGTTRFNDLHEDLQKEITLLDKVIQTQIQLKNDCDAIMPSHGSQLSNIPHDVEFCRRKLIGVENAIESDAESISLVRDLVKTDAENAKLSFKAIDNLKLPAQYHNAGIWSTKSGSNDNRSQNNGGGDAQNLVGFFSTTADELSATLAKYQKNITEIEQHLRGMEASSAQQITSLVARRNGGSGGQEDTVQELASALLEFEQSILGVAGKVGGLREGVQGLQLGGFAGNTNGRSTNVKGGIY